MVVAVFNKDIFGGDVANIMQDEMILHFLQKSFLLKEVEANSYFLDIDPNYFHSFISHINMKRIETSNAGTKSATRLRVHHPSLKFFTYPIWLV